MRVAILSFIILAAISFVANGQQRRFSVSGYIHEEGSLEPLSGVVINSAGTNAAGYYSLKLSPGEHTLTYSMTGYKTAQIEINLTRDTVINLTLEIDPVTIEEVVVTGKTSTVHSKGLGVVGVNMQQLKYAPALLGEQDVIKYLQLMPGVTSGKEGAAQLAVRGGGGDQTLIVLDDIPIFNQNHAFGFVSIFNGDLLSSAELYKGYVPAIYGGRLSSVASLKMRDGNKYEHHQSLTLGTTTLSAMVEGPIVKGKGSYLVSARQFTPYLLLSAFWAIRGDDGFKILYSFYDVNAKVNYQLNKNNTIFASIYNGMDFFSNDAVYKYEDIQTGERLTESKNGNGFKWGNLSGSLRLNTILGSNIFMNNAIYYSGLSNNESSYFDNVKDGDNLKSMVDSKISEIGFRSSIEQKLGESHSLIYGLHGSLQIFTPQTTSAIRNGVITKREFDNRDLYTATAFIEDEIKVGRFKFNAGLRLSMFHNTQRAMAAVEPRVAALWAIDKKNDVWLSYNRSTQPLFTTNKTVMNFPFYFWLPYTGRKLESADQISIGWKTQPLKNLTFTLESYYKHFNNLSHIESLDDYLMNEADALASKGKAYGVEFLAQYNLRRFSFVGSYTYSRSLREIDGVTFPYAYDIPHNMSVFASYTTLKRSDKTHVVSVSVNWCSGMPYKFSNVIYPTPGGSSLPGLGDDILDTPLYPNARLNPYFRTDLSFSMERKMRRGTRTWQFSILNATNHVNPYIVYREGTQYKYSTIMPIMPSFSYKRTF